MSTVLGLSVAKDEAVTEATEDRDVAKSKAEDGLVDGVVDAVIGWLNGTSDARTVYNVTMIGLAAARGVAYRTALGAFDVADINRALDAGKNTQSTNSARNLANAQAERDAVVNRPQSEWSSQAPFAPMSWFGSPFTAEEVAAQTATQYRETMDAWGVTALRTWIAEVDASGVLDDDEAEQSPASLGPDSSTNNPPTGGAGTNPGAGAAAPPANGGDSGTTNSQPPTPFEQELQSLLNDLRNGTTGPSAPPGGLTLPDPGADGQAFGAEQEFVIPLRRLGPLGEIDEIEAAFAPILNALHGRAIQINVTGGPLSNYVSTPYANADFVEKFTATFLYAVDNEMFPADLQDRVEVLAQPENLAIMAGVLGGTVGLFALLQATPVGWAADVLALGLAGVGGASAAVNIGDAINSVARIETESDRRDAARQLAQQLNGAVIDALLGLVGGNGGKIADKAKDGLETVGRIRGIGFEGLGANGGNIRIKLAPKANSRLDNLNHLADDAIDAAGKKADEAIDDFNDSVVRFVDENSSMDDLAKRYEDGAAGARSNLKTRRRQSPAIERTLEDGTKKPVKFDGIEDGTLIDRKRAITTFPKSKDQALRQSNALMENGMKARWEVPNSAEAQRARKILQDLGINNIEVVEVPELP